jgi:hypothetical protein
MRRCAPLLSSLLAALSLVDLATEVMRDGSPDRFTGPVARKRGLPDGAFFRFKTVPLEEASDGMAHEFDVLFGRDPKTRKERVIGVLLTALKEEYNPGAPLVDREQRVFRLDLAGKVQLAFIHRGMRDLAGKPVRGSARDVDLDLKDARTKAMLEHELAFWQKGRFRKENR